MNQSVYLNGQSHRSKEELSFVALKLSVTSLMENLLEQLSFKTTVSMTCTSALCRQNQSGGKDDTSEPCINTSSISASAYDYQQWLTKQIQNLTNYLKLSALRKKADLDNFIKTVTQSYTGNFAQNVNG